MCIRDRNKFLLVVSINLIELLFNTMFKVKLTNPEEELDVVIDCPEGENVLDVAEKAGIDLPYSCRGGSCSSCAGKIIKGQLDQSEQIFLTDDQIDAGFVLTCIAIPESDCEIVTHMEEELF